MGRWLLFTYADVPIALSSATKGERSVDQCGDDDEDYGERRDGIFHGGAFRSKGMHDVVKITKLVGGKHGFHRANQSINKSINR